VIFLLDVGSAFVFLSIINNSNNTIMGFFSFLKGAGKKLFGVKDEPVVPNAQTDDTIQAEIEAIRKQTREAALASEVVNHGINIENLSVSLNGDTAIIYGQAINQEDKEKAILCVGNVDGIAMVDDRIEVVEPSGESQFHTVEKGDSLSKIAKEYYGDMMKYPVIFEANKPMLEHPDKIYPGQVLRIPPIA